MLRIIVVHEGYGCDTGCCGHVIKIDEEQEGKFYFEHPYGQDHVEFIRKLVSDQLGEEHIKDIDFEHCIILED